MIQIVWWQCRWRVKITNINFSQGWHVTSVYRRGKKQLLAFAHVWPWTECMKRYRMALYEGHGDCCYSGEHQQDWPPHHLDRFKRLHDASQRSSMMTDTSCLPASPGDQPQGCPPRARPRQSWSGSSLPPSQGWPASQETQASERKCEERERERSAPWRSRKILDSRLPTERTSVSQSVEWDTYRAGVAKTTSTRQVILTRKQKLTWFRSPFCLM